MRVWIGMYSVDRVINNSKMLSQSTLILVRRRQRKRDREEVVFSVVESVPEEHKAKKKQNVPWVCV